MKNSCLVLSVLMDGDLSVSVHRNLDSVITQAKVFFVRLIMCADDFGRYFADPKLLRSYLYPLREDIRTTDITRLTAECEKAGLIACYEADRKRYIEILNFQQRVRTPSKFPPRDAQLSAPCMTNDRQMTDKCQSNDRQMSALGEGEGEDVLKKKYKKEIFPSLTPEENELFNRWIAVWINQHSRNATMPDLVKESHLAALLRIPAERRIEALNESIKGCWKYIHDPAVEPKWKTQTQKGIYQDGHHIADASTFTRHDEL